MDKQITIFKDDSQHAYLKIISKPNDYYEMVSVQTGAVQLHDSFELHENEMLELGTWIVEELKQKGKII